MAEEKGMNPTPEQATIITKCKVLLKGAFSQFTGKMEFHMKKEKPNADQVDVKVFYDVGKQ